MLNDWFLIHSHYQVGVVLLPDGASIQNLGHPDTQFPNINEVPYDPSFCDRASPSVATAYVTAEFASNLFPPDREFIVGQEEVTGNSPNDRTAVYTNGLLCNSKSYTFFLRAYPVANPTVSSLHFSLFTCVYSSVLRAMTMITFWACLVLCTEPEEVSPPGKHETVQLLQFNILY